MPEQDWARVAHLTDPVIPNPDLPGLDVQKVKLMRDFMSEGRDELYDLADDPGETRNLINDSSPRVRAVITELHQRIIDQMKRVNDPALPLALKR